MSDRAARESAWGPRGCGGDVHRASGAVPDIFRDLGVHIGGISPLVMMEGRVGPMVRFSLFEEKCIWLACILSI